MIGGVPPHAPTTDTESWRRIGPERVGLVLSVLVVLASFGVASALGASQGATPRPTTAQGSAAPTGRVAAATAHPFAATASLALHFHELLAEDRHVLELELAASKFDLSAVVDTVRRLNATAHLGSDAARALQRTAGSREVGTALVDFYGSVAEAAESALGKSVADAPGYRAAAKRLLAVLAPIASLQERLEALIASARSPSIASVPTPDPSTPPATATPPSTPPATPSPATPSPVAPTATPTARPTSSPNAPSPTVGPSIRPLGGQVQNPGFEATDPSPWTLTLESPALATMIVDSAAVPFEGERSARIDISIPSDARTGVALRQAGIKVAQSHPYVCSVAVRAAVEREVRIRVASSSGATYGTRVVTVGPVWTLVEFEFSSFVEDPSAVIEIDLGRSATTTWIDAVQITDALGTLP
jgi:carbohydrate binding protein with CBM4/9 domain